MNQIYKSVKKGQKSIQITKKLLDGIYTKSQTLGKDTMLILTIPISDKEFYKVECTVLKFNSFKGDMKNER